jgi:HK97 family phage prohead protease
MSLRHAIASHGTATSEAAWDGPANESRLKIGESADYYRKAYAWVDPDKDAATKAAYRFIHHEVDSAGTIGAANVKACANGIGILNGGRGGTDIPDGDREGVYRHLASHLKDAGKEPPELKSFSLMERRAFPALELRAAVPEAETRPHIIGHAAVFNSLSEMLWGFREMIAPGAFRDAILVSDVRALLNHEPSFVLGRKKNGTLKLWEDERGLAIDIDPPETQWANDLLVSIGRGDIDQMSFGFTVGEDRWEEIDGEMRRTILRVDELFDVSPVTFPAYPETDAALRVWFAERIEKLKAPVSKEALSIVQEYSLDSFKRKLRLMELTR